VVTTNVWLQGPHTLWLAADHPAVLAVSAAPGYVVDSTFSVLIHSPTGPLNLTVASDQVDVINGVGKVSISSNRFAGAPSLRWTEPVPGSQVLLVPYRKGMRCASSAVVLRLEDVLMPTDAGDVVFRGGAYKANTHAGDCGAPILGAGGVVGMHAAGGASSNAFIIPPVTAQGKKTGVRIVDVRPKSALRPASRASSRGSSASRGPSRFHARPDVRAESGIVGMSPAPSDYIGPGRNENTDLVSSYVDCLVNPWSGSMVRLPDHCIAPTCLLKMFANRTYTVANCSTFGTDLIFGMHTKLSNYSTGIATYTDPVTGDAVARAVLPLESADISSTQSPYRYSPGDILGGGGSLPVRFKTDLFDSTATLGSTILGNLADGSGFWADDFGAQSASVLPYISSYRLLSAAIRMRIVGLPSGVFMTPGKVYFAQLRYDADDWPVSEQDFVTLETKGRATHVSADAVREAGSKTIFYTPDGAEKFAMQSSFLPAPGVFPVTVATANSGVGFRCFPDFDAYQAYVNAPSDNRWPASRCIVPYYTAATLGDVVPGASARVDGVADASDAYVADTTSILVIGYFGCQDGVALELDYAKVYEFIPNKNAPSGFEALVQLPASGQMDNIFSAAAILANARAKMVQAPGDKTILGSSPDVLHKPSAEGRRVKEGIMRAVLGSRGRAVRPGEGFWDALKSAAGAGLASLGASLQDEYPTPTPAARPPDRPRGRSASRRRG